MPAYSSSSIERETVDVLELPDGVRVGLPVMRLRGRKGPKLVIVAAIDGWEVVGVDVIRRVLTEEVNPTALRGSIVAVPVGNPIAFQRSAYKFATDILDVDACFPGDEKGSASQRIASALWEIIKGSDCYLNVHGMEGPSVPFSVLAGTDKNREVSRLSSEIAKAFGVLRVQPPVEEGKRRYTSSNTYAIEHGVPGFTVELPQPGQFIDERDVATGVRGVLNVMRHLKMIRGRPEPQPDRPDIGDPVQYEGLFAGRGGLVHPSCRPGEMVRAGQTVARTLSVFGDVAEELKSPRDGVVMSYPVSHAGIPVNQVVTTGDPVCWIGYNG